MFIVVIITYFSLIVGELVPKRLAHSVILETISIICALILNHMANLASPIVYGSYIQYTLGIVSKSTHKITEEEVQVLIIAGSEARVFKPKEKDMDRRNNALCDKSIKSFMTLE
ncbi:MAG: CNNM domain-containing protein [Rickettsiales endosymbiont of Dermacentor nuttalli]